MLLYGVSRFIIEFYRYDPRGMVGMFSTSQFVSLLIVPLSIIMLLVLRRRMGPAPADTQSARAA
jgi:phosphatidylglycerol:prolipoprotein diacylglycerol transferase